MAPSTPFVQGVPLLLPSHQGRKAGAGRTRADRPWHQEGRWAVLLDEKSPSTNSSAPFGRAWGGGCIRNGSVRTREEEGQGLHPRTYVRLTAYNMHLLPAPQNVQNNSSDPFSDLFCMCPYPSHTPKTCRRIRTLKKVNVYLSKKEAVTVYELFCTFCPTGRGRGGCRKIPPLPRITSYYLPKFKLGPLADKFDLSHSSKPPQKKSQTPPIEHPFPSLPKPAEEFKSDGLRFLPNACSPHRNSSALHDSENPQEPRSRKFPLAISPFPATPSTP
jgi:hypothetical protein